MAAAENPNHISWVLSESIDTNTPDDIPAMVSPDVVPVTVSLNPGRASAVSVPAETHILYFCKLWPYVPEGKLSETAIQARRNRILGSLLEGVEASLSVDGDSVPLVEEVIRDTGCAGVGFWNITEPLSRGEHTGTVTLTSDTDAELDSPPSCRVNSDNEALSWDDGQAVSEVGITVVTEDREHFETATDPLWSRREVYRSA